MKYLVYDLETKEKPGTEEVSWKAFDKMGISVGCAWLSWVGEFRLYDESNLPELLMDMKEADVVTGWNVIAFDWPLILGTLSRMGWRPAEVEMREIVGKHYCPLNDIRSVRGPVAKGGWKLDDVLARLGLALKKGNGADAPGLFKDGKWAKLHTYVLGDVRSERDLFQYCMSNRSLPDNTGEFVHLPMMNKLLERFA